MNALEYKERCHQCMAVIDSHENAKAAMHSFRNLSRFNVCMESLIIGSSGYVGFKSYQVAKEEASFIRSLTGNAIALRIFNPVPLCTGAVVAFTSLFLISDLSRLSSYKRLERLQDKALVRAKDDLNRLESSNPIH